MEEHTIISAILVEARHPKEYKDLLELEKSVCVGDWLKRADPGKGKASA